MKGITTDAKTQVARHKASVGSQANSPRVATTVKAVQRRAQATPGRASSGRGQVEAVSRVSAINVRAGSKPRAAKAVPARTTQATGKYSHATEEVIKLVAVALVVLALLSFDHRLAIGVAVGYLIGVISHV